MWTCSGDCWASLPVSMKSGASQTRLQSSSFLNKSLKGIFICKFGFYTNFIKPHAPSTFLCQDIYAENEQVKHPWESTRPSSWLLMPTSPQQIAKANTQVVQVLDRRGQLEAYQVAPSHFDKG